MATGRTDWVRAAVLMPAHLLALLASLGASVVVDDPAPLLATLLAQVGYLALLGSSGGFRRWVQGNAQAQVQEVAPPQPARQALQAGLSPSQRQHLAQLEELKASTLAQYRRLPGGQVLAASSEPRLDSLVDTFARLVSALNSYRTFLGAGERKALEAELAALEAEVAQETKEKLREVKRQRLDILSRRLQRYREAEESRELVSHQLAGLEDLLRLTHEQAISIKDPDAVSRQLDSLAAQAQASEETVRELEGFMQITEEFSDGLTQGQARERVR